jgi:hypothetical protein
MSDPIAVAERILIEAIRRGKTKDVLGAMLVLMIRYANDIAVQQGIPKDEWLRDFAAAYERSAGYFALKGPHAN